MPGQSRIGDVGVGICCCHSDPTCIPMVGSIISGSGNVVADGRGCARIGDIVLGGCGHVGVLVSGSGSVIANSKGLVRTGDAFAGCFIGSIVSGSGDVITA